MLLQNLCLSGHFICKNVPENFILFQNGNVFNSLAKIRLDVMDGFNEALNIAEKTRLHIQ